MSRGHKIHPSILRAYDIRGVVGDTLRGRDIEFAARAFGSMVTEAGGKSIALGYDGRLHSPDFEVISVNALKECGLSVFRVGLGPSPMLYFASHLFHADAALMITGSHNPPDHNGMKMSLKGEPFFGENIQRLGARAKSGEFVDGKGSEETHDIRQAYADRLIMDYYGTRKLKVAWDPGNGAAGEITELLTSKLPGEHILINTKIDGTFPTHHPDPTVETNLEELKIVVKNQRCDLGIAFDGDGDRLGVIDSTGTVLWGDQILVILARDVLADQPGATIIGDVKTSQVFQDEITRLGGKPILWKTGHSHIKQKLAELGAPLAGEMSAHIFFRHRYYGYDDALYSAVRLISTLACGEETLADIRASLPHYINTPELRFACSDQRKFEVIEEVKDRLHGRPKIHVNNIDGVRVESSEGWWLLRASNTQPVLVARCESETLSGLEYLKAELVLQLRESGVEPPDMD
ncbi:MAG: phosphomannomutase [Magnetovibrio sp.]|nr:phosphomannomutase [Magnetovibrio sp.]